MVFGKLFPRDETARRTTHATDYIDLSDYTPENGAVEAATLVRFARLTKLEDLKHFTTHVYDGHVLILDFRSVADDEILLRRLSNELRRIATDVDGDITGVGDHHIMLTPAGVKVARKPLTVEDTTETRSLPVQ